MKANTNELTPESLTAFFTATRADGDGFPPFVILVSSFVIHTGGVA